MNINEITKEQLQEVSDNYGSDIFAEPHIVPTENAKALEYKLRTVPLAVAMQRYEAASNVLGALAFGVELGIKLAQLKKE